ncbi:MAG: hypothetical protein J0J01_28300 [Reyranella sp.]|uniref:hypothetical protein n=1 Tax=Reyranella sp. TaxID=1929291 RepID=UPI001ACCD0C8|nr:hypothetical protein [Reyranella sp.]MBN9090834.1 hypothetical protein [Reyranella sp.]
MRRFLAAALAALLIAGTSPAGAVEVTIVGAGGAAGHSLAIGTNDAQFDWSIVVRRNDKGDPKEDKDPTICLDATPLVATQGGAVVTGARLSVDGKESTDEVCAPLRPYEQKTFKFAGSLPADGEFKLQLGLIVKGEGRQPYDATITRKNPTTRLGFVGVGSDGKMAMNSDRAAFAWPLMIRRNDREAPPELPVTLRASTFTGPGGRIIAPRLMRDGQPVKPDEPLKLGPFGEALVMLVPGDDAANLADVEGAYVGEILYEVQGARASVTLTLNRQLPDLDFKAEPISKLRGVVGGSPVGFHLYLQNTTGAPRPLYAPKIFHLDRIDAVASPSVEVAPRDYAVTVTGPAAFPQTVEANQPVDLMVTLAGLNEAGSYKGVVRLAAPDRKPLDVAFELSLRLCWWYAAAAILLGVVLAALARFLQQYLQPRLLLQQEALEVRGKLDELRQAQDYDLTAGERDVIGALATEIDRIGARLRSPFVSIDDVSTRIAAVRVRLPLLPAWITARRRRAAVRPLTIGDVVDADLDTAQAALTKLAAPATDVTAALTLMNGVEGRLRTRLLQVIKQAADDMRAEIAALPILSQLAADSVRADLGAVDAAVTATRVDEARAALDRARTSYVIARSGALRIAIAVPNPPFGFDAAQWTTYRADILRQLDEVLAEPSPESRVGRWNTLIFAYLRDVVQHAVDAVDGKLQQAPLADAVKAAWQAARGKLEEAAIAARDRHFTTAQRAYDDALRLARDALTTQAGVAAAPAMPAAMAAVAAFAAAPAAGGAAPPATSWGDVAVAVLLPLPLGPRATTAGVQSALLWSTGLLLVFGLFVATVSGVQVLYEPNPTFGWKDLVAAFLWGAGIQAAAGQAFQGLSTLFRS